MSETPIAFGYKFRKLLSNICTIPAREQGNEQYGFVAHSVLINRKYSDQWRIPRKKRSTITSHDTTLMNYMVLSQQWWFFKIQNKVLTALTVNRNETYFHSLSSSSELTAKQLHVYNLRSFCATQWTKSLNTTLYRIWWDLLKLEPSQCKK